MLTYLKNNLPRFGSAVGQLGVQVIAGTPCMHAVTNFNSSNYAKGIENSVLTLFILTFHNSKNQLIRSNIGWGATLTGLIGTVGAVGSFLSTQNENLTERAKKILKNGGGQVLVAAGIYKLINHLGVEKTAKLAQSLVLGSYSANVAKNGIKDLQNGKYLKGTGKLFLGTAGVVTSVWAGYRMMIQPESFISDVLKNNPICFSNPDDTCPNEQLLLNQALTQRIQQLSPQDVLQKTPVSLPVVDQVYQNQFFNNSNFRA